MNLSIVCPLPEVLYAEEVSTTVQKYSFAYWVFDHTP
ncbi:hypothetical protein J2W97_003868 [Paenibacillus jamilae]|nr:hypothetical protein [Paenibacillus jamilae]